MVTGSLLELTLGIAFYLLPAASLAVTAVFLVLHNRLQSRAASLPPARKVVRDPLLVTALLAMSGPVMVSGLTGRWSWIDYARVPLASARVAWLGLTDWNDPLSSEAISLRGGVVIGAASAAVFLVSLVGYYRRALPGEAAGATGGPGD